MRLVLFIALILLSAVPALHSADVSNCSVINASGSYVQTADLEGSPLTPSSPAYTNQRACIVFNASDIDYDCGGYAVANNGTSGNTTGFFAARRSNITLHNCPTVGNYTIGVQLDQSNDSVISGVGAINNSKAGILLTNGGARNLVTGCTLSRNSFSASGAILPVTAYITSSETNFTYNTITEIRNTSIRTSGANNVIRGNTMDDFLGANVQGIYVSGSDNQTIADNVINGATSAGINAQAGENHDISNNTVTGCSGNAIMVGAPGSVIHGNAALDSAGSSSGIYVSSGDADVRNNTASGNSYGIRIYATTNATLINNTATGNRNIGIQLYRSNGSAVINNTAGDNPDYDIDLENTKDNLVSSNSLYYSSVGVMVHYGRNNTVDSNTAEEAYQAFYIHSSDNNFVSNNSATGSDNCVHLEMADNNLVTGNNASGNALNGIYLAGSDNNTIAGNYVINSTQYGIYLSNSAGNSILSNAVADTSIGLFTDGYGIYLANSPDNAILSNNITNSLRRGIFAEWSNNATVVSNLLADNVETAIYMDHSFESSVLQNNVTGSQNGISFINSGLDNVSMNVLNGASASGGISMAAADFSEVGLNAVDGFSTGISIMSSSSHVALNSVAGAASLGIQLSGNGNTVELNNVSGSLRGISVSGNDNNVSANDVEGSGLYGLELSSGTGNSVLWNTLNESGAFDLWLEPVPALCGSSVEGNIGSGGRPILFANSAGDWGSTVASELVICDADGAQVSEVHVAGSDTLANNGVLLYLTSGANLTGIESAGNLYGLLAMTGSPPDDSWTVVRGLIAAGNTYGVNVTDSDHLSIEDSIIGGNGNNLTVSAISVSGTIMLRNVTFIGPGGNSIISLLDSVSDSVYYIDGAPIPPLPPGPPYPLTNGSVEIWAGSGLVSLDEINWSWTDAEASGLYEPSFDVMLYNTTEWVPLLADIDTGENSLSMDDLVPSSRYSIFFTPHDDGGEESSAQFECYTDGECGDCEECSGRACVQIPGCECVRDSMCPESDYCRGTSCVSVSCECGRVSDHACDEYECCADSACPAWNTCTGNVCVPIGFGCDSDNDCADDQRCDIPAGQPGGACADITGCGEAAGHRLMPWECGAGCPPCPEGSSCMLHACAKDAPKPEPEPALTCPMSGLVGEDKVCVAKIGSEACANCGLIITDPAGRNFTGRTDAEGNFALPLTMEGIYTVTLTKDGKAVRTLQVQSLAASTQAGGEKPVADADGAAPSALIIIALLMAILAFFYFRRKKKPQGEGEPAQAQKMR
jgi:parallel beta-helix repeat protein